MKPNYAPSRVVRILEISLALSIFPEAKRFTGEATLRFEPLPRYEGVAVFDLDEVTVEEVSDPDGHPLKFSHTDANLRVQAGEHRQIRVRWHGENPQRGMYFPGPKPSAPDRRPMAWTQCQDEDGHFVFPCHDHPGTKHPWSIRLEGPVGFTLLSNGQPTGSGVDGDRCWATFEQAEPMPAYLFTAVCAELSVVESAWRGRPVRYFVPVGLEEAVVRSMGKTPVMIEEFSNKTGVDYPWPRYDQVIVYDFIFGGMENIACTTMTDLLLVDEKAVLEWDPDGLVAHELAHQWFGDLVTCQDWSQGWLNESWATFMESVWLEADRDPEEAIWSRFITQGEYLHEFRSRYRRPLVSYNFREPIDVFDRHLYQKGSCVLWTLRGYLGERAFWAGVNRYLTSNAHDSVHSRDFQRALERATGENLDQFFRQWVFSPAHPELEISLSEKGGAVICSVRQTQSGDDVPDAYGFRLPIEILTEKGVSTRVLHIDERDRTWVLPVDGAIKTVRVDPGLSVLSTHKWKAPRGWLVANLSDPDPVIAVRAATALLDEGSFPAVAAVRKKMIDHDFWGVRAALAAKIGVRHTDVDRGALIDLLQLDADPRVRGAAATALGSYRSEDVVDALIGVTEEDVSTWQLLGACLMALGKTRSPAAVELLRKHVNTQSWAQTVSTRAIAGLAATRDPEVLPMLLRHTSDIFDDRTRSAAAGALATLGDRVESVRTEVVERLIEMLTEPGFRAQLASIAALARLKDARATGTLSRIHRGAPDGRTRRAAYEALVAIRSGRTSEESLQSLRTELDALREQNADLKGRLDRLETTEA